MKKRNAATMILLVVVTLFVTFGCGKKEEKEPALRIEQKTMAPVETKQSIIAYETLRRWTIPAGGVGMEILVSENATKEEVLALARHLRSNSPPKGLLIINIFDSKEAYLHRDDPNYPEERYSKHWLVNVLGKRETGDDKINWVAEGRDH
jgi:hypothetical protein